MSFDGVYHADADVTELGHVLAGELDPAEEGDVVLILTDPLWYNDVLRESVSALVIRRGMRGCILSTDKPCVSLNKLFSKGGVSHDKVSLLEASSYAGGNHAPNCKTVQLHSLNDFALKANKLLERSDIEFSMLASVSTLREMHDRKSTVQFVHRSAEKRRREGVLFVMVALKGVREGTVSAIMPFCDSVIDLGSKEGVDEPARQERSAISQETFEVFSEREG